ncbi:MAG TPA: MoaD/ThiS family protein [Saprospiraceae bacterium]|nr:MoaD/ThiS family protein [Saprospiraceae bacterium]
MIKINFTPALQRFFPKIQSQEVEAETVLEALEMLEKKYPGINAYLRDESGRLRKHINIFIDQELIQDRQELADPLDRKQELLIFQALSGG